MLYSANSKEVYKMLYLKGKKWIKTVSFLLLLFVFAAQFNFTVLLADERIERKSQIGKYYELDEQDEFVEGTETWGSQVEVMKPVNGQDTTMIKMETEISDTEAEDLFDVTLRVATTEVLEEFFIPQDAAVVLLFDVSNSMDTSLEEHTRLEAAKKAAKEFVSSYAKEEEEGKRMISLVEFGTHAKNKKIDQMQWFDAVGKEKEVHNVLDSVEIQSGKNGATNIEGALLLAQNLLNRKEVAAYRNKNIILLTDGAPTASVKEGEDRKSTTFLNGVYDVRAENHENAKDGFWNHAKPAENTAKNIKNMDSDITLFTIAFAVGETNLAYPDRPASEGIPQEKTTWDWLEEEIASFGKAYQSGNAGQLILTFQSIVQQIKLLAKAWQVTAPMGEFLEFRYFHGKDAEAIRTFRDNSIFWNLKEEVPLVEEENNQKWFHYALSFRARLKTEAPRFLEDEFYPTNKRTKLDFVITDESLGKKNIKLETEYFKIPSVKGFLSAFTGLKQAYNTALQGAKFELTGSTTGGGIVEEERLTAVSSKEGIFSFKGIPSGKFLLKETQAPEGYEASNDMYRVATSYGEVVSIESNDTEEDYKERLVVENCLTQQPFQVSVWKKWLNIPNEVKPPSVQVELWRDGKYLKTGVLSEENDWIYEFLNLDKYNLATGREYLYEIREIVPPGYTSEKIEQWTKNQLCVLLKNTFVDSPTQEPPKPSIPPIGSPTPVPTNTPVPTSTPVPTATPTATPAPTGTPVVTPTPSITPTEEVPVPSIPGGMPEEDPPSPTATPTPTMTPIPTKGEEGEDVVIPTPPAGGGSSVITPNLPAGKPSDSEDSEEGEQELLPQTGTLSPLVFYGVGAACFVVGGACLIHKKDKKKKRDGI